MTTCRMRIACWIPKATNTHSENVILIPFPLQQRLHESASVLCFMFVACRVYVICFFNIKAAAKVLGLDLHIHETSSLKSIAYFGVISSRYFRKLSFFLHP